MIYLLFILMLGSRVICSSSEFIVKLNSAYADALTDSSLSLGSSSKYGLRQKCPVDVLMNEKWKLTPLLTTLAMSRSSLNRNAHLEIPEIPDLPTYDIEVLRKHELHTFYQIEIDTLTSLSEFKGIMSRCPGAVEEMVDMSVPISRSQSAQCYRQANGDVSSSRGSTPKTRDYSDCSKYPCQGYLHYDHSEIPKQYAMLGNNIKRVWEDYNVKGEGVQLIIMEPGFVTNDVHNDISVPTTRVGVALNEASQHKVGSAGVVVAEHNNRLVQGIAPNVNRLIDFSSDDREWEHFEKVISESKKGDVMTVGMVFNLPPSQAAELREKDINVICDDLYPAIFNPYFNKFFNALHDKGVTVFTALPNSGTDLNLKFWRELYPISRRGKQTAVTVTNWDVILDEPSIYASYVGKVDPDFVAIQFGNWGTEVVTLAYDNGGINTTFDGTSAATPITAGVAVLVQCAAKKYLGSFLEPSEVISVMYETGSTLTNKTLKFKDFSQTRLPNAYAAVEKVIGKCTNAQTGICSQSATKLITVKAKSTTKKKTTTLGKGNTTTKKTTTLGKGSTTTTKTTTQGKGSVTKNV